MATPPMLLLFKTIGGNGNQQGSRQKAYTEGNQHGKVELRRSARLNGELAKDIKSQVANEKGLQSKSSINNL